MKLHFLTVACDEAPGDDAWLSSHERARSLGMRVPKRRADFRGGRWAAKRALRTVITDPLDLQQIDVRAAEDGSPLVVLPSGPSPFAVSIAHAGGRALAVVGARDAIFGADIEEVEPRSPAFIDDYFLEAERAWIERHAVVLRDEAVTLLWSAKESVLKALREGLREDTREALVTFDPGALPIPNTPSFQPFRAIARARGRTFAGLAARDGSRVITIVAEAASIEAIPIL